MLTIKEAVKGTVSKFNYACAGVLYYIDYVGDDQYQFSIDMNNKDDVGTSNFEATYKSITLMRYISKAIEKGEFIKIK